LVVCPQTKFSLW